MIALPQPESKNDHYFEVRMIGVPLDSGLLEESDVWSYLSETAPVDFKGTWVLTEKLYDQDEFTTAEITINSDGSYSLLVDGKEMNTENHLIDLENANNENCCHAYVFYGIITENGELFCEFMYYYDEEEDCWYYTTGFFAKQ